MAADYIYAKCGSGVSSFVIHSATNSSYPRTCSSKSGVLYTGFAQSSTDCWIDTVSTTTSGTVMVGVLSNDVIVNSWPLAGDRYIATNTGGSSTQVRHIVIYVEPGISVTLDAGAGRFGNDRYVNFTISAGGYIRFANYNPTRSGYRLLGWDTSPNATTVRYSTTAILGPLYGNSYTFYAVWGQNPFITLNANGGSFSTVSGATQYSRFYIDYGGYVYFSNYTPTRDGYTLLGWSANQTATSPTYGVNGSVGPLYGSSYTFYAVWQKSTVTITLNGTGGFWYDPTTGNYYTISVTRTVGDTFSFSTFATVQRDKYTLLGWSANPNATTATYGVNGSVQVGATDATYYAVWQRKTIDRFYWAGNDTNDNNLFQKGKLISGALTAARWNNLLAKIKEVAEANGGTFTYTQVSSGAKIMATTFNVARNGISGLTGHGTLPSAQTAGNNILASLFNGNNSLKSALNAAIDRYNNT